MTDLENALYRTIRAPWRVSHTVGGSPAVFDMGDTCIMAGESVMETEKQEGGWTRCVGAERAEAVTTLVAAAPELCAALRNLVAELAAAGHDGPALAEARAALILVHWL